MSVALLQQPKDMRPASVLLKNAGPERLRCHHVAYHRSALRLRRSTSRLRHGRLVHAPGRVCCGRNAELHPLSSSDPRRPSASIDRVILPRVRVARGRRGRSAQLADGLNKKFQAHSGSRAGNCGPYARRARSRARAARWLARRERSLCPARCRGCRRHARSPPGRRWRDRLHHFDRTGSAGEIHRAIPLPAPANYRRNARKLEHCQETWIPVFCPKMGQCKKAGVVSVSSRCETTPDLARHRAWNRDGAIWRRAVTRPVSQKCCACV
jgi:hypothetical protein